MCTETTGQAAVHCLHGIASEVLAQPVGQQHGVCLLCAAAEAQPDMHPAVQVNTVDAERTNLLMFHSDLTAGNMELDKGKPPKCGLLPPRNASSWEHPAVSPGQCLLPNWHGQMGAAENFNTVPCAEAHAACSSLFDSRVMR